MKRFAVILILVGVFTFCPVGAAMAQPGTPVQLCVDGFTAHLIATYVGSVGIKYVYALNGWIYHPLFEDGVVCGTATISKTTIHWGLTLLNAIGYSSPYVLDFITDLSLNGEGELQDLTGLEGSTDFTVSPGTCPPTE